MFTKELDLKVIFIIVLGAALVLSLLFNPRKTTDGYEDKVKELEKQNSSLLLKNDSLKLVNGVMLEKIKLMGAVIDSNMVKIAKSDKKIKELQDKRNETLIHVNGLDANGISSGLSDYLKGGN